MQSTACFRAGVTTLQVLLLALSDVYELLRHGRARNQERAVLLAEYARLRAAQGSPERDTSPRASTGGAPVNPAATAAGRGPQPAHCSGGAAGLDCQAAGPQQQQQAAPAEATTFSRETTKFWVQPHNLMWVKCALVRHLPLSVYGRRSRVAALEGERCYGTMLDCSAMPQLRISCESGDRMYLHCQHQAKAVQKRSLPCCRFSLQHKHTPVRGAWSANFPAVLCSW